MGSLLCLVALAPLVRPSGTANRIANTILAGFWLWVGLMFWWPSRSAFPPALLLSAVFTIQGLLFLVEVIRPHLDYRFTRSPSSTFGALALVYTLIYPLVGLLFGHTYPHMALSVLFPCPLAVFTFGLLLTSKTKIPKYLLVIPLIWSLSGLYWAPFGMWEDAGLLLVGLIGTWIIWRRDRKTAAVERPPQATRAAG